MALTITPYAVQLDSANPNAEFPQHLMQGSTDAKFVIMLLKDGVEQIVDSGAKVTMILNYGVSSSCGNVATKGSYVLASGDSGYDIAINTGKIEIPLSEKITDASGLNQMILKIEDGTIAYTYSMLYNVDLNAAYTQQSTPDNLPTYKDIKDEVEAIKTDVIGNTSKISTNTSDIAQNDNDIIAIKQDIQGLKTKDTGHDNDITQVKQDVVNLKAKDTTLQSDIDDLNTDVQQHNVDIPDIKNDVQTNKDTIDTKASKDLSNVEGFVAGKEGDLFYKKGNKLEVAPLNIDDTKQEVSSPYSFKTAPNTLKLGENVEIHENGGFIETETKTEGNPYLLVDYENDPLTGTKKPIYYERGAKVLKHELFNQNDTVTILGSVNLGSTQFEHQTQAFYLNLVDAVQNMYLKISTSKGDIAYHPSEAGWNAVTSEEKQKFPGYNSGTGLQKFALKPFWSSLNNYELTLTFKADSSIRVLGDGSKPYLAIDENPITRKTMALMEDITGGVVPDLENVLASGNDAKGDNLENLGHISTFLKNGKNWQMNNEDGDFKLLDQDGTTFLDVKQTGQIVTPTFDSDNIPSSAVAKFIDLTDTPSDYIGNANKFLKVNSAHTGVVFADGVLGDKTFTELTDTPADYAGMNGKIVAVKSSEDGVEFIDNISGDTSNLAKKDLTNVDSAVLKTKSVAAGMLQQDLEDVDLSKLYDKGTDAKLADLDIQNNLVTEVNRLKTDISNITPQTLPTYVFRDRGIPSSIPADKQYKAYYIHSLVLQDSNQVLNIPSNVPNGAIFSVENNDRTDSLSLRPPTGETINGNTGIYQCGHDTLNYFVKDGTDFKLAYGGVFPNSYNAMKSTIQSLFPNSLHTAAEVEAQLKDRLHTFREIQSEFSGQLHTLPAIEADMINRGFLKEGGKLGMQGDQSVPISDSWSIDPFMANEEVIIPAQNKGNQYIVFSLPSTTSAVVSKVIINGSEMEFSKHDFVDNELHYKVFIADSTIDSSQTVRFKLDFDIDVSSSGIEIDDGTTNKAGIGKINIKGAYLSKVYDDSDEVDLKCVTSFETLDGMGGGRVNRVLTEAPLLSVLDSDTKPGEEDRIKLYLQHDYFELAKPPGYLAYLSENEEVIGRVKQGEVGVRTALIWFDDNVVGGNSPFIEIDKPNKALGIQDYTDDDPVVTGGIPTLIAFRVAMKDKAPNDGFVELILKKTDEGTPTQDGGYLLNANGQPIGIRKQYKSGDDLGVLDAMAIYMAKGLTKFQCIVEHNFIDDGVMLEDRTEGASGILIQALGTDYATGDALLQFENDTMQNIEMSKHYNGPDIFNMAWALSYDRADTDITAGTGQTSVDGLHFYNNTNLNVGIADKTIHIHDNGADMAYFSLGQIFSAEKTHMLKNKELDIKVTLQDKENAFRIYMVKWTGKPDAYTNKVIASYDADTGAVADTNWTLTGNIFISEDAASGEHDFMGTLTVPADAVNFAVVIAPGAEATPIDLYMKGFKIDVSDPFYGWILEAPELIGEKHLQFDERHAELRCDVAGYASVRYTLNNVPTGMPMPIGIIKNGKADIEIDHTVNQVSGSQLPQFEGAIKFNKEGKATIQTDLYVHSEKAHSTLVTTKFWYSKVSPDAGTFTKIPLSEYTTQVRGQTKAINKMPRFEINVQPGDRIALFGTSDQADGAFINQNAGDPTPMLKTIIEFNEVTEVETNVADLMQHADEIIFVDNGKPVADPSKYRLEIDIKTGQTEIKEV